MGNYIEQKLISNSMKFGVEEILLGDKTSDKCGLEIHGLLANHLSVKEADGQVITLLDYIDKRINAIHNGNVVALDKMIIPVVSYGIYSLIN